MDPRLEAVRFPQVRDPAPGEDEGVLQRVLGETGVAQDPMGDRVERVADLVHQDGERLTIAPRACSTRSRSTRPPVAPEPRGPGSPTMTGGRWRGTFSRRPTTSLRRSSRTTSRQRPRPSWPIPRWTPTRRNPTDSWSARQAAFSAMTPANSVQNPAASDAGMRRLEQGPADAATAGLLGHVDALPGDAAVDLAAPSSCPARSSRGPGRPPRRGRRAGNPAGASGRSGPSRAPRAPAWRRRSRCPRRRSAGPSGQSAAVIGSMRNAMLAPVGMIVAVQARGRRARCGVSEARRGARSASVDLVARARGSGRASRRGPRAGSPCRPSRCRSGRPGRRRASAEARASISPNENCASDQRPRLVSSPFTVGGHRQVEAGARRARRRARPA